MADELELIQAMAVLSVQPGDVVVLKVPVPLTWELQKQIRELVEPIVKTEVLILSHGVDIGVIRNSDYIDTRTLEDAA